MATKYIDFYGPCKWAKLFKPDDKYNNYQIQVYLDEVALETFKNSGLQLKTKEDEDGTYVTFRRPVTKLIKGEAVELGQPKVVDKDGNDMTDLVGNGSMVKVTVAVYDTMKGKGHTLHRVQVNELVKYERKED